MLAYPANYPAESDSRLSRRLITSTKGIMYIAHSLSIKELTGYT
jgi:hypothetical protein